MSTEDYSDLIARLRLYMAVSSDTFGIVRDCHAAADAIKRLSQRVQQQALEKISLAAQCDEHVARIAELEAKNAAWVQQKIDADARIAALESQIAARESAEPICWVVEWEPPATGPQPTWVRAFVNEIDAIEHAKSVKFGARIIAGYAQPAAAASEDAEPPVKKWYDLNQ